MWSFVKQSPFKYARVKTRSLFLSMVLHSYSSFSHSPMAPNRAIDLVLAVALGKLKRHRESKVFLSKIKKIRWTQKGAGNESMKESLLSIVKLTVT